jgi:hypothetical protein
MAMLAGSDLWLDILAGYFGWLFLINMQIG